MPAFNIPLTHKYLVCNLQWYVKTNDLDNAKKNAEGMKPDRGVIYENVNNYDWFELKTKG